MTGTGEGQVHGTLSSAARKTSSYSGPQAPKEPPRPRSRRAAILRIPLSTANPIRGLEGTRRMAPAIPQRTDGRAAAQGGRSRHAAASYAKALLAATKQTDLMKPDEPKRVSGLTSEQMLRMEREMETLQRDLKLVEARYGDDTLHSVIAAAYLSKLLNNPNIRGYLEQHHPEILTEFNAIATAASLDQASASA